MMKITGYTLLVVGVLLIGPSSAWSIQQEEEVIYVAPYSFEDLSYPVVGLKDRIQGAVIVKWKKDEDGNVETSALSGPKALIPDSLANAKNWRFNTRSAFIVYEFRLERAGCHDGSRSLFLLKQPKLATIIACSPSMNAQLMTATPMTPVEIEIKFVTERSELQLQREEKLNEAAAAVVSFEELRYPPIARVVRFQGVVIVQAKLDDHGNVVRTSALAGQKLLLADSLSNVKKWKFIPNSQKSTIVAYDFRIDDSCVDAKKNVFQRVYNNFATVTTCAVAIDPSTPHRK